jgi:hypothetical protein
MSADYLIKFVGHIVPALRPHGFPDKVSTHLVVRVDTMEGLLAATNRKFAGFITNHGMFASLSPENEVEKAEFIPDLQIFVPMGMLSFIETVTIKLAGEVQEDPQKFVH